VHSTASSVLYIQVVLNIIFFKMIYFCKVKEKNEKAYSHLILFVHQSPHDKVRRHLPKISVKSGGFQLLGSSASDYRSFCEYSTAFSAPISQSVMKMIAMMTIAYRFTTLPS
jgi:hypothetical protein